MTDAAHPIDDLEAIRIILETLRKLPAEDHARVLRYVHEKLGVAAPASHGGGAGSGAAVSSAAATAKPDIRTFIETKKPNNDVQFAAAVAYFYAFEALPADRKPEINKDDLQEATRMAHRDRLACPPPWSSRSCPIFRASVRLAIIRWLPSAEKSSFGIGPTREDASATLGGRTKQNGTENGRRNSLMFGRKLFTAPTTAPSILLM